VVHQASKRSQQEASTLAVYAPPVLVSVLLSALLALLILNLYGFNPTGPIMIGDQWDGRRFWTPETRVLPGVGYDGQFFYYLAQDPLLLSSDAPTQFDNPPYRAGRILYPLLTYLLALGQPSLIPWALLAVNVLAAAAATAAAVAITRTLGARPTFSLWVLLSPSIFVGLIADLAEPTAVACLVLGVALYLRGRLGWAGLALALATLAREVSGAVPAIFAAHALWRRRWRQAALYLAPLALPALWHLWVGVRYGGLPLLKANPNFGFPLSGALYRAGVLLGLTDPLLGPRQPPDPFPELLIVVASVALLLSGLLRLRRHRDDQSLQLALQSASVLATEASSRVAVGSYSRVVGIPLLLAGLCWLMDRQQAKARRDIVHLVALRAEHSTPPPPASRAA
jgi:hypothetical protein